MFSFTIRRLIGAAAAVCLTASAVVVGSVAVPAQTLALPGASESTVVTIEPTRVTDTRYKIGVTGQITAKTPRKLTVTGRIDTYLDATSKTVVKQVVPFGATGVFLNVTVVTPSSPGFLSIRPGTASGVPATGGLNFGQGTVLANGILVALPTTGNKGGQIDIYYGTPTRGASMHVIIDVVGYTTASGLIDLVNRVEQLENSGGTGTGVDGVGQTRLLQTGDIEVPPYGYTSGTIYCPAGFVPTGTGLMTAGYQNFVQIFGNFMGYFLDNKLSFTATVSAQVVCLGGQSSGARTSSGDSSQAESAWESQLESLKLQHAEASD
jgi:hypothetical protein